MESKKTVESYQPVLNMKGLKYKGLIPATFSTEAASRFQKWSGVYLKQTAPEHLLRNTSNKPDSFEAEHMKELEPGIGPTREGSSRQQDRRRKQRASYAPALLRKGLFELPWGTKRRTGYFRIFQRGRQKVSLVGRSASKLI